MRTCFLWAISTTTTRCMSPTIVDVDWPLKRTIHTTEPQLSRLFLAAESTAKSSGLPSGHRSVVKHRMLLLYFLRKASN